LLLRSDISVRSTLENVTYYVSKYYYILLVTAEMYKSLLDLIA